MKSLASLFHPPFSFFTKYLTVVLAFEQQCNLCSGMSPAHSLLPLGTWLPVIDRADLLAPDLSL